MEAYSIKERLIIKIKDAIESAFNNDTVVEDKNMSTVYFDKQVLNPHAQGTQAYTNWEQGFMEAANKYFKLSLSSLNLNTKLPLDLKIPDNLKETVEKYGHKENEFSSLNTNETVMPDKKPTPKDGLVGVTMIGNVTDYNISATIDLRNGKPYAIAMNGYVFYPTLNVLPEQPTNDTGKEENIIKDGFSIKSYTDGYQTGYKTALKYAPEQPTNDNAFIWTDKLVAEFAMYWRDGVAPYGKEYVPQSIEVFKSRQSKQSEPLPSDTVSKEYRAGDEVSFEISVISLTPPRKLTLNGKIKECLYFKNTATVRYLNPFTAEVETRDFEFNKLQSPKN